MRDPPNVFSMTQDLVFEDLQKCISCDENLICLFCFSVTITVMFEDSWCPQS